MLLQIVLDDEGDIVKLPAKRIAQARELRARNRNDSPIVCVRIARGR